MNKREVKKLPALRFKGFTNDWEQRKLGDETNRIKSYSISHGFEVAEETGTKYIHYGDIHTGKVKNINNIDVLPNIKDNNYKPLKYGDVIVADASEDYKGIADACIVNTISDSYKIVAGLHTIAFRPKSKLYSEFLYFYLSTDIFKHFGYKTGTGLKVFGISYKELAKFKLKEPSVTEQKKIVKLLFFIEKVINLQQRKLGYYIKIKTEYSNKIFSCNHSFKNKVKGQDLFFSISKKGYSALPVLSATQDKGMVPRMNIDKQILYKKSNLINYKLIEPGDFVVHLRSFQGGFAYSKIKGIASPAYTVFRFKDSRQFDPIFWEEKFKSYSFIQLLKKVTYGVRDGKSINFKDFCTLYLTFPSIKTQKKIGSTFHKLNTLIAIQEKKIKELQEVKKFLLQNMFI